MTRNGRRSAAPAVGAPAVGLVLGAGGVAGQAYHAGVLHTLETELGWDARGAEVIVGTSAGSITGAILRGGVPASDLVAWGRQAPLSVEGQMLAELFGEEFPELRPLRGHHFLRRPRVPPRELLTRALLRPWQFRPVAAVTSVIAPGSLDIVEHLKPLKGIEERGWPDRDLWICAVRRRDGRRVVFGRPGSPPAPLELAVAASCAIPGYFAPVQINGRAYVDGGAHSPTNAAILRDRSLDLVIVVSPMSGTELGRRDLNGLVRRHAAHRLRLEVRALRRAGVPVVVFEPGPDEQDVMGMDMLSRDNVVPVAEAAAAGTLAQLEDDRVARRLEPLRASVPIDRGESGSTVA